jgi:uncharacterized surface protein with fasciclin (FAS1) repeats
MDEKLIQMSRTYGSNPAYVLAGGGNTSYKTENRLFVKASGHALKTIDHDGFAELDRDKLNMMWKTEYPKDTASREAAVLKDLMDARVPGETNRPSVETQLHDLLSFRYVLHLHPTLVNGLTCSLDGETWAKKNLGTDVLWIEALSTPTLLSVWVNGNLIVDGQVVTHDMVPNIGPYYINNDAQFSDFEMIMDDTLVIDGENVENMSLLEWPEEGEVINGNTNPAFEGQVVVVDAYTAEDLLANPELSNILQFHVVEGLVLSEDILEAAPLEVTTLLGETLSVEVIEGAVYINGIEVVLADLETTNGVIHVIEGVLLP